MFARPIGEDEYGTVLKIDVVPDELKAALDEESRYVLPSFINATVHHDNQECWVVEQVPAPDTLLSCEQIAHLELNTVAEAAQNTGRGCRCVWKTERRRHCRSPLTPVMTRT